MENVMLKGAALFVLLSTCATCNATESYLCVADVATGFAFDGEQWHAATFAPSAKYIISRSEIKGFSWQAKEVGSKVAHILCKNEFSSSGSLICDGFTQISMNRINGRFLAVFPYGYWTDHEGAKDDALIGKEGANTPSMEIGKCSPL